MILFCHAGWSSTIRLAWHCSIPGFACPPHCFSVCINGDHETSPGREMDLFFCISLLFIQWFFNPELFWFHRQMIRLKRIHFLFSSFYPSWLVTSLCLFHQDYLYTGSFLSGNVTHNWMHACFVVMYLASLIDFEEARSPSIYDFVPSIKTSHIILLLWNIISRNSTSVIFISCICACSVHIYTFLHMEKFWTLFIMCHRGILTGALTSVSL